MDGLSLLVLATFGLLQIFTDLCRRKARLLSRSVLVFGLLCLGHLLGCFDETLKMTTQHETAKRALITSTSATQNQSIILFLTPQSYGADPLWYLGKELTNPFAGQRCAHSRCVISGDHRLFDRASLVVFHGPFASQCCAKTGQSVTCSVGNWSLKQTFVVPKASPTRAIMFFQREAPARTERKCLEALDDTVNYTWSYKRGSDVFFPYGRVERLTNVSKKLEDRGFKSYARNVLWYVSNCRGTIHARSRYEYAMALSKYIDVDIYGQCSGRSDGCGRDAAGGACRSKHRSRYRFYLAFENSHCDEYVTEKFFEALQQGNVPIVRGLPKHKYQAVAPPNSFIHADDFDSPASLARYLRWLAASGDRYARYHDWRRSYVVRSEAKDLCKLCELATLRPARTVHLSRWWSKEGNCLP